MILHNVKNHIWITLQKRGAIFGKTYTTAKTSSNQVTKQVAIGNNSAEVIDNIIMTLEQELQPIASHDLRQVATDYFGSEQELIQKILTKLSDIQKNLLAEKM